MTTLRNFFLATAFSASLPAMAALSTPVIINFEETAPAVVWLDENGDPSVDNAFTGYAKPGTGDGQAVGSFYNTLAHDFGVTFAPNAYTFNSNSLPQDQVVYGKNVDTPDLANNLVFMSPYTTSPETCSADKNTPGCGSTDLISTLVTITNPLDRRYVQVDFSWTANIGSNGKVTFISTNGVDTITATKGLDPSDKHLDACTPTSSFWWCDWKSLETPYSVPTGFVLQKIEFTGGEGSIFYDDIKLTALTIPEPSTYALTLFGLIGIRFLAVRRRRPN